MLDPKNVKPVEKNEPILVQLLRVAKTSQIRKNEVERIIAFREKHSVLLDALCGEEVGEALAFQYGYNCAMQAMAQLLQETQRRIELLQAQEKEQEKAKASAGESDNDDGRSPEGKQTGAREIL